MDMAFADLLMEDLLCRGLSDPVPDVVTLQGTSGDGGEVAAWAHHD